MQANNNDRKQNDRTFTEIARRTQIVEAAIETIADLGYARASFAQIAWRAGLSSTGVISYHFDGKDDLMKEVVTEVLSVYASFVRPRTEAENTAAGTVRAYLEASPEFMGAHRNHLLALLDIAANSRSSEVGPLRDEIREADLVSLEQVLREGQERGEFREFDAWVMAVAIRSVRDGMMQRLAADPDLDLDAYARELVTLFDLATRKTQ